MKTKVNNFTTVHFLWFVSEKKHVMKNILFILSSVLLFSCSADDAVVTSEEVTLFVNHYKTTSVLNGTSLLIQEDAAIGTSDFEKTPFIEGFSFEPGFTYTLTATKIITENAGTNATMTSYELISVVDQTQVAPEVTFSVPLARFVNGLGYVSWLVGNQQTGFVLSNEININCGSLCPSLETVHANGEIATGVFVHGEEGTYVLQELF
jgi:hypothetical protein